MNHFFQMIVNDLLSTMFRTIIRCLIEGAGPPAADLRLLGWSSEAVFDRLGPVE